MADGTDILPTADVAVDTGAWSKGASASFFAAVDDALTSASIGDAATATGNVNVWANDGKLILSLANTTADVNAVTSVTVGLYARSQGVTPLSLRLQLLSNGVAISAPVDVSIPATAAALQGVFTIDSDTTSPLAIGGASFNALQLAMWPIEGDISGTITVYAARVTAYRYLTVSDTAYLTVDEANTIAESLPGMSGFLAAPIIDRAAALEQASDRFDTARRYQGRKYDPSQTLEFPRFVGTPSVDNCLPMAFAGVAGGVWDWDADAEAAIVPGRVLRAVVYEAASIIDGGRDRTADAIHDGLAGQSIGSASESYRAPTSSDGLPLLCREADAASRRYQLRSGAIL